MNSDLKIIKKKYGENFSKLCRELFPSILENKGELVSIITSLFKENHFLYDDLIIYNMVNSFQKLIMNEYGKKINNVIDTDKNPYELFKEKGYTLKECHTNEEILSYKKYYIKEEELCTFKSDRLRTNIVFFAVKDNALDIKRKSNPQREDEYGTSVLSLQFTLDTNYLSIKNRYNHTVNNPDATYQNNLENIAKGLTYSFEKYLGIKQSNINIDFEMPNYVRTVDGKYYRYNVECNNIYYCPDNIVIHNFKEVSFPKEKYILFDGLVLDLTKKTFKCYDNCRYDSSEDFIKYIKKIAIENNSDSKSIYIICEDNIKIYLELNKFNELISVLLEGVERLNDDVFANSFHIKRFSSKDTKVVEDRVLRDAFELEYIYLPKCEIIGNSFALRAENLKTINLPSVKKVDYSFIAYAKNVQSIYMPNLQVVGNSFLYYNEKLKSIFLPSLEKTGYSFMYENNSLEKCDLPKLVKAGSSFMKKNTCLKEFNAPSLKVIESSFLSNNLALEHLYLPNIEEIEENFLVSNKKIRNLYIPTVKFIGNGFLYSNRDIINNLYLPNLLSFEGNDLSLQR